MSQEKIGLALGAGGYRGLAHVGVIKALVDNDIPIDCIAGSSSGALIGGAYLALGDIAKVEEIILKLDLKQLFSALFDLSITAGLLKGDKAIAFIEEKIGQHNIEDLPKPFAAVTTNLFSGQTSPVMKGSLAAAIRASGSVPLTFTPVEHKGERYVDGALSMPVPVKIARSLGADKVIAVNLYNYMFPLEKKPEEKSNASVVEVAKIIHKLFMYNLSLNSARQAEVVVNPKVDNSDGSFRGFVTNKDTIKVGYQAAEKVMDKIKNLAE